MKICIVIQSEAFRSSAGVRIRYDRFNEALAGSGTTIDTIPFRDLAAAKSLDHDVYIFCKTFETAALLLARRIAAAGKAVGQDLFDDYFSQYSDSRLARFRQWMRDMAPVTDFAICSTAAMADAVQPYLTGIPIVTIEDPVEGFDEASVRKLAATKERVAKATRTLEIAWFGIGDNPFFPVGLADLALCDPQLARMQRLGFDVRLKIITNQRPFEGTGAEILRRLSVGFEVIEWTEQAELAALAEAIIAVIPVNGQSFSRAKSMNRAVTALNQGCQVLSLGYPLYASLDEFIYRSGEELVRDLEQSTLKVRTDTMPALTARLLDLADPLTGATRFVEEARKAVVRSTDRTGRPRVVCLIHGRASKIETHKAVSAQGGLSIGTIFSTPEWNYPVRFDRAGREIVMHVTPDLARRFDLPLRPSTTVSKIRHLEFVQIDQVAMGVRQFFLDLPQKSGAVAELAIYEDVMRFVQECCLAAFRGADLLISDTSHLTRQPIGLPARPAPKRRQSSPRRLEAGSATVDPNISSTDQPRPVSVVRSLQRRFLHRSRSKSERKKALALLEQSPLFDAQWYLERYPDVASSGLDPAVHYLEHGWRENRNPGPGFSSRRYLKANKDVAARGLNPLIHYIEHGQWEGRKAFPVLNHASAK